MALPSRRFRLQVGLLELARQLLHLVLVSSHIALVLEQVAVELDVLVGDGGDRGVNEDVPGDRSRRRRRGGEDAAVRDEDLFGVARDDAYSAWRMFELATERQRMVGGGTNRG